MLLLEIVRVTISCNKESLTITIVMLCTRPSLDHSSISKLAYPFGDDKVMCCNLFSSRVIAWTFKRCCQFCDCHLPSAPMAITTVFRVLVDESHCRLAFLAKTGFALKAEHFNIPQHQCCIYLSDYKFPLFVNNEDF